MATTQKEHNGNGTVRRFDFTFPYIKEDDVRVSLRTSTADVNVIDSTKYTFPSATEIQFNALSGAATTFQETTGAPKTGVTVRIFRDTDLDTERVTFFPGSSIRAQDLNDNTLQNLYASQERQNRAVDSTGGAMTGDLAMNNANIVFEGATANAHETTLTVTDPTADRTITLPDTTGTVVTTGDTNTITSAMVDGSLVNANVAANAEIAVSKLADGDARQLLQTSANGNDVEWTSNVDIPGTLDVTGAATFDGTVTAGTFSGNATSSSVLNPGRSIGGVAFDGSANINLPGVNAAGNQNTSGNAATATKFANAVNIAGQAFDGSAAINISPTNLVQNINGSNVSVSADANEINQLDGIDLIPNSPTWTSTTQIPSNAQISSRIAELGGFEAIADETKFPNAVPPAGVVISIGNAHDLAVNGSGVGTGATVGGTSVTINGFPNTFNNTSLDNGIGLLVVKTGGNDAANQVYDFHRVVAKNEDVRQLSSDMNDFKARYRVGSTVPSDGLCALNGTGTGNRPCNGDLFYNTASNSLLVYDAGTNSTDTDQAVQALFTEVQSVGEYFIIPANTFPNWNGQINDIPNVANIPNNAEQILLSINGVIQEPNAGTGRPTDGFSINQSTIQLAAAPPAGSDAWGVIIGSTVNINEPSGNSVRTVALQEHCVTYGKIQDISTDQRLLGRNNANDGIVSEVQVQSGMIGNNQVTFGKIAQITNANRVLGATSGTSNVGEVQVNEAMLNISNTPTDGQFLRCTDINSTPRTLEWATPTDTNTTVVVNDTSPQLGGNLNVSTDNNTHRSIISSNNGDITLTPNGTGTVEVKRASSAVNPLAAGNATVPVDLSAANNHSLTGNGNITGYTLQNPTNAQAGQTGSIFIVQPANNVGSGNTFTLTPDTAWHFAKGGAHPTFSTANGAVDRIDYIVRSESNPLSIHCVATFNYS